jgi:hypothetical protein
MVTRFSDTVPIVVATDNKLLLLKDTFEHKILNKLAWKIIAL